MIWKKSWSDCSSQTRSRTLALYKCEEMAGAISAPWIDCEFFQEQIVIEDCEINVFENFGCTDCNADYNSNSGTCECIGIDGKHILFVVNTL